MGLQGSTGLEECDQGTYLWQADKASQGLEEKSLTPFSACACCALVTPSVTSAFQVLVQTPCSSTFITLVLQLEGQWTGILAILEQGWRMLASTASVEVSLAFFHSRLVPGIQED